MYFRALKILNDAGGIIKSPHRDLQIFTKLMDLCGNPHKSFKSIHITGTNGKGSTVIKIATALQKSGYKTGMYTSPHIFDIMQRIKINNANIKDEYFADTIIRLHKLQNLYNLELSFFDYLTATAFLYFKDFNCDFACVEVGLGGRYDATNIIAPQISVITSIALDHQQILGSTRQQIAFQKAGIIKPNIPVVVGPHAQLPIIFQQSKKLNSKVYLLNKKIFYTFDEQNRAISKMVLQILKEKELASISFLAMRNGLNSQQPCRMEVFDNLPKLYGRKRIILDVAHNPNATQKMIEFFNKKLRIRPQQKIAVIFGSSKYKRANQSLLLLEKFANLIYLVQAYNLEKSMKIQDFTSFCSLSPYSTKYKIIENGQIYKAMIDALAQQNIQTIIVCGSFSIIPEAKNALKLRTLIPNGGYGSDGNLERSQ